MYNAMKNPIKKAKIKVFLNFPHLIFEISWLITGISLITTYTFYLILIKLDFYFWKLLFKFVPVYII